MNATEWAAWVGACSGLTGLGSLGWQVYTKVTSGPRLRVTAFANMVMRPAPPGDPRLLRITIQNVGSGPTTITNLTFMTFLSRWARWRCRPSSPCAVLGMYKGPPLPYKLEVGGEFVAVQEQEEKFDKWLSSGNLWCAVVHSFSTRPALAKIFYPKE